MRIMNIQSFKNKTGMLKFVVLGLLWGGSFLLIKLSLEGFSAPQVGLMRLGIGGAVLSLTAVVTRRPWPRGMRQHCSLCLVSVFMFVLPVSLYSWAGQFIPSSISAILNATTPIMTILVATIGLSAGRPGPRQVAGVLIGAVGIVLVFQPWSATVRFGDSKTLLAMLACLGATLSYAIAYVLMTRLLSDAQQHASKSPPIDAVSGTAEQLFWATGICVALSGVTGFWEHTPIWNAQAVVAMTILGVLSTGVGYSLNTQLTEELGSVKTSQVTYVTPVVGVVLGWMLLKETVNTFQIVGGCIVLFGIWVTRSRPKRQDRQ